MNHLELQALRRLFFYSVPEAAKWAAATKGRPDGVQERTWRLWESAGLPVPDDVAARMRHLLELRQTMLSEASAEIARKMAEYGEPEEIVMTWYATLGQWQRRGEPDYEWRPQCSVVAELAARYPNVVLAELV